MNASADSDTLNRPSRRPPLLHWLISRNPFYIVSAGLLLYSIYRLSVDPNLFATELAQLLFNFGSFQLYELLLVGTAIFLVGRGIRYDSALLVGLENLFVLVPFILISQALLIEGEIAAILCFGATALAAIRFAGIRKYYRAINLPRRLVMLFGFLLLVNLALPILIKTLHREANSEIWSIRGPQFNSAMWLICMPLLVACCNLLPRPRETGESMLQKGYFPLLVSAVWLVGTGVHLYSIGYVYGLRWSLPAALPMLWAAAWTLWNRFYDFDLFDSETDADFHNLLLLPPAMVTAVLGLYQQWGVFLALALANVVLYATLVYRHRSLPAFQLLMFSGAMVLAGLPESMRAPLSLSRIGAFAGAFGIYIVIRSVFSRNPKLALVAAIILGTGLAIVFHRVPHSLNAAAQVSLVFLVLHSFRWLEREHVGANVVRNIVSVLWVLHSIVWLTSDGNSAWATTATFAMVVLGIYGAVKAIFNQWGPRIVPAAATIVLVTKPVLLGASLLDNAPVGVLALLASFLLFAFGTAMALLRSRHGKTEVIAVSPRN